jgi:lysophospholipase L1-like esterase
MFDTPASRRSFVRGAFVAATIVSLTATRAAAKAGTAPKHIVLLGDSIFANTAYVGSGPDVIEQLNRRLPAGARATLNAVDGAVASAIKLQLQIAPEDTTHIVISAGGNDALHQAGLLEEKASSVAEALGKLAAVQERFADDYRAMLDAVTARGLPVAVCTIYDPRFDDAKQRRIAAIGLSVFNDIITREAAARGLALIDLRLICTEPGDLANPIEPSVQGGAKIAGAITAFATDYDFTKGRCEVFAGSGAKT